MLDIYFLIVNFPLKMFSFFAFFVGTLSLWVKKTALIWGSFFTLSLALAYQSGLIEVTALVPIVVLGFLQWMLKYNLRGVSRFVIVTAAVLVSLGLWMHKFPGFHNWKVMEDTLSPGAISYRLWMNYDKPWVGIFPLAFLLPLVSSWQEFRKVIKMSFPWVALSVIIMFSLGFFTGIIKYDPKLPDMTAAFMIVNFFLVAIPEEAFMRGFVQRELCDFLGKGVLWQVLGIVATSVLFTALHVFWISDPRFLTLVFVAGLVFGGIYQYTKAIESSILAHFLFNACHFLFFTYPVLK